MLDSLLSFINGGGNKATLGGIELEIITSKTIGTAVDVTSRRVEKGFVIGDTTRVNPTVLDLEVVDTSSLFALNKQELKKLVEAGEPTTYIYSNGEEYQDVIIENFTEIYKPEIEGMTYGIRLKKIIQAEKAEETMTVSEEANLPQGEVKKVANQSPATVTEQKTVQEKVKSSGLKNIFGG